MGISVFILSPKKSLTGLTTSAYDFYVRANCSVSSNSNWVGPINVIAVTGGGNTTYGYMNASINGQQFTGMKPFYYPFTGLKAKLQLGGDPAVGKILWVQGDTNPLDPTDTNNLEINLYINQALWHPGTYVLQPHTFAPNPSANVDLIIITPSNPAAIYEDEIAGSITITEFNSVTKRITGTFSFTYNLNNNGVLTGPFPVTNGSFDFELDATVFQ